MAVVCIHALGARPPSREARRRSSAPLRLCVEIGVAGRPGAAGSMEAVGTANGRCTTNPVARRIRPGIHRVGDGNWRHASHPWSGRVRDGNCVATRDAPSATTGAPMSKDRADATTAEDPRESEDRMVYNAEAPTGRTKKARASVLGQDDLGLACAAASSSMVLILRPRSRRRRGSL